MELEQVYESVFFGNHMDSLGENLLPPDQQINARTKAEYPYSYDPILIFETRVKERNGTIYSDRLLQWDREKHDALCIKLFGNKGQYWNGRHPKLVEAFLCDWCKCPELELARIVEYCNAANGYPCWRFDYYQPQPHGESKP